MDAVKFTQSFNEVESINAAHNLAPVDLVKEFTEDLAAPIKQGTLLKVYDGALLPWVQGTDNANLIVGIYAGATPIDTGADVFGLVRVFGPVRRSKLVAWTASNGSTQAAANAASIAALEALKIYAL